MTLALIALLLSGDVLAAQPLPRGTVLTAAHVSSTPDTDISAYLGRQLVRPVFAGKPISPSDLAAPDLVRRQDGVTIRYARGTLTLGLPGRALSAGAAGETVSVLAEGRRRPIRAVVTGHGEVAVAR